MARGFSPACPALRFHELSYRLGCHAGERDAFSSSTLSAHDAYGAAREAEKGGEIVDERLVGGAFDRRRRQAHYEGIVAHAAQFGFSCAGNHADVDLDARVRFTNQGWP